MTVAVHGTAEGKPSQGTAEKGRDDDVHVLPVMVFGKFPNLFKFLVSRAAPVSHSRFVR